MDHLPIFLRVQDRETVVVGGGAVAARKAELLARCGARVTLVAPELSKPAAELVARERSRVRHLQAAFEPEHLAGASLVVAAADSAHANAAVAAAAGARHLPVNVVDDLRLSSFILPAVVDRSPVIVAIGSQGTAPVLARRLREQIEALLPARLGALARFAGSRRGAVQRTLRPSERRPFWERIFGGPVSAQVLAGDEGAGDAAFAGELAAFRGGRPTVGEVYLIGAGPGDPDLLTLRALQLLQQADVVLYDRLVSPGVLDRARREAERIFVGKSSPQSGERADRSPPQTAGEAGIAQLGEPQSGERADRSPPRTAGEAGIAQPDEPQSGERADGSPPQAQERIHDLMVSYAERGLRVARLKGGDPLIFGRGGEEIRVLAQRGIPFTVVPGITAGLAAAATAGIPLTQREIAQSVTFATGHFADGDGLDWRAFARPRHTVVFYMAVSQMERIVSRLLEEGAPRERPAAVVERATLPGQRVLRGSLGEIASLARAERIAAPALLIVGEAAAAEAPSAAIQSLTEALRGVA